VHAWKSPGRVKESCLWSQGATAQIASVSSTVASMLPHVQLDGDANPSADRLSTRDSGAAAADTASGVVTTTLDLPSGLTVAAHSATLPDESVPATHQRYVTVVGKEHQYYFRNTGFQSNIKLCT
jgi:hypothetical protein